MAKERIKNGYGVYVTLDPTRAELKQIADKTRKGLYTKKPYQKVAAFLDRWVQKNFSSEGKLATGQGWQPFSKYNRRALRDPSAKLLQDTGRGRSSFQPFYNVMNAGIGSKLHYMEKHHEGKGVPERPILPKRKQVWPDVKKILSMHTMDTLKKSFKSMRKGINK